MPEPATRRRRAAGFGIAALACAAAAAAIAGGYGSTVASRYGELRPVVVARRDLPARRAIALGDLRRSLEVRRVPARFVPTGALEAPEQAVGQAPAGPVPAGSYLIAAQLTVPRSGGRRGPALPPGRRPVEIAVTGADALFAGGSEPEGSRVDVVVTTEPAAAGSGRTYVAAAGVPLLALRQGGAGANPDQDPAAVWTATLALTRTQALELIEAESFARQLRLLPR